MMNVTTTTNELNESSPSHNATKEQFLAELHAKLVKEYTPVIAFIVVQIVVGIIGNTLAFVFYCFKTKKNNSTVFIASLAAIDLWDCIMYTWHLLDVVINVYFDSPLACQLYYFCNHSAVTASIIMLQVITLDRYLKICRPFAGQFNLKRTKMAVFAVVLASLIVAARDFVILDAVEVQMTNSNGTLTTVHYCSHTDNPSLKTFIMISNLFDSCVVSVVTLSFSCFYSVIIYTIVQHKRNFRSGSSGSIIFLNKQPSASSRSSGDIQSHKSKVSSRENSTSACDDSHDANDTTAHAANSKHTPETRNKNRKVALISSAERNITYTMLIIAIGCVGSFIPYFLFVMNIRASPVTLESELTLGPQLMFRTYLLNSVINPFVYCFFNTQFRQFLCNTCLSYRRHG